MMLVVVMVLPTWVVVVELGFEVEECDGYEREMHILLLKDMLSDICFLTHT